MGEERGSRHVLSGFISRDLAGRDTARLREWIHREYFAGWPVAELGSLVFVLTFLAISYGVVLVRFRERLFFKL